ncbi:sensor histidine kinase [Clostridium cellulovorans]|uniref:histidine kinase n=1 Tax=Clostridium cellulovorans (strain ATCC 35296 / DSM 3052 / OCM 3 / 743B) TaxID=573061 RepID=D9SMP0_CLOC7|nr:sensor histidine kinase [Clostridium cellulovorans]ADL49825.1 integral membrane sensor signal transduction histidine kinase [Clostridium cellulovorans 743B]
MKSLKIFKKVISNMRIRNRLMAIYVIAGLIPLLLVGTYLTISTRNIVRERAVSEAEANSDRIVDRIKEITDLASDVSELLYVDKRLQSLVTTQYNEKDRSLILEDYEQYTTITEYMNYYASIDDIILYVKNETVLDWSIVKVTDRIAAQPWYQKTIKNGAKITWQYVYDEYLDKYNLALHRVIKNDNGNEIGVLQIKVTEQPLKNIIQDEPFDTFIILNDEVIISNDKRTEDVSIANINYKDNGISYIEYGNEKIVAISRNITSNEINSIKVVSMIPLNKIYRQSDLKSATGFAIIFISMAISIIIIFKFSNNFSKRVIVFKGEMHKVVSGDFEIIKTLEGDDEIAELYDDLYKMIDSIQLLINQVYVEKIQKEQLASKQKDVEFKMLASQINPHFLYNTLETIRMKAYCNEQYEIAEIVKILAKIMRRNLEINDNLVSLESEITMIKNYLKIQKFRFGDRITYDINIECNIDDYYVLPLLFQPVVENAFVHGFEHKQGIGEIKIIISKDENRLIFSIRDNGVGISPETLENLRASISNINYKGKSIGLNNVNHRIKIYYGDEYGVEIFSGLEVGTEVKIYLPIN